MWHASRGVAGEAWCGVVWQASRGVVCCGVAWCNRRGVV